MKLSFRWFGPREDPISLKEIRQIPGMKGVVTALHRFAAGEVWPLKLLEERKQNIEEHGLELSCVESIFLHESIKYGGDERDKYIESYQESIRNLGRCGIPVLCYNFMPVFDWTRTDLDFELPTGAQVLDYKHSDMEQYDIHRGSLDLPGWALAYSREQLDALLKAYHGLDEEKLWENLKYFIEAIVPVAEESGVKLAVHPDDPPWPVFGLPRILKNEQDFEKFLSLSDSPAHGMTFCTGSLGADPQNDLPVMLEKFFDRVNFMHCRNVEIDAEKCFRETYHNAEYGVVDLPVIIKILVEKGFDGPLRPDHGPKLWDEHCRPGYPLAGRALGATYLQGLWDACSLQQESSLRKA